MRSTTIRSLSLWHSKDANSCQSTAVPSALELRADDFESATVADSQGVAVLQPVQPLAGYIGALLVAENSSRRVSINGIPRPAGLHLLRHADRVDIGQNTFWVSTRATVGETAYDPTVHGEEVFCFLTKARLVAGQPIKICPGVAGTDCGVIYKAAAWDMAMTSSTPMKCPNCGYLPNQAEWHPPKSKDKKAIDDILRLLDN